MTGQSTGENGRRPGELGAALALGLQPIRTIGKVKGRDFLEAERLRQASLEEVLARLSPLHVPQATDSRVVIETTTRAHAGADEKASGDTVTVLPVPMGQEATSRRERLKALRTKPLAVVVGAGCLFQLAPNCCQGLSCTRGLLACNLAEQADVLLPGARELLNEVEPRTQPIVANWNWEFAKLGMQHQLQGAKREAQIPPPGRAAWTLKEGRQAQRGGRQSPLEIAQFAHVDADLHWRQLEPPTNLLQRQMRMGFGAVNLRNHGPPKRPKHRRFKPPELRRQQLRPKAAARQRTRGDAHAGTTFEPTG